jgi:hypothetical protein
MKTLKFDFQEAKRVLPADLMQLYETTLGCKNLAAWERLCGCLNNRWDLLLSQRRQLNEAARKLIKSSKAFIDIETKRQQTPKSHQKELLDMTFDSGFYYAVCSIDKIEYEVLQKVYTNNEVEFEALKVFSARVLENMKELGAQLGPTYYHGTDKDGNPLPYYSGPQRPPRRPTANDWIPGHAEDPSIERCYCLTCKEFVEPNFDAAQGRVKCEDHMHLRCGRMLSTVIKMGADKREPFDPDKDADMSRA